MYYSRPMWRLLQFSIFVGFVFANIYFRWGIDGLAAGVMGGMLAWYSTFIVSRVLWASGLGPRFGIEEPPSITLLYQPSKPVPLPQKTDDLRLDRP